MNIRLFVCLSLLSLVLTANAAPGGSLETSFQHPPAALRPMPLLWLNGTLTPTEIQSQLQGARDQSGFGGVAPLPLEGRYGHTLPKYLTDDYFARYGDILNTARELGMEVILYDDEGFPSGSAGGRMMKLFPDDTLKRLDKVEEEVQGPTNYSRDLPAGALMGVVAMNPQTWQRIDLTTNVSASHLTWQAPAGAWKVMLFTCVATGNQLVDFMSPEAVDKLITLTYGEYFKRFPEHFGSTIHRNFFDDVGFHGKARPWTTAFNEKFQKQYGVSPVPLYPALWRDIGPDTEAARVALFAFRAELLAEGYPGRVGAWCRAHGIQSEGHPPGNYDPCPVDIHCDTLKFYRHVDIPLMDAIFYHGHGRPGFKLISSAATMYDRPLVAAEEYGAYAEKDFDSVMLYRTGLELFARGVNRVIPHGQWLDPEHVRPPPLISHLSAKLLPSLRGYSEWSARCSLMLQGGRPVVDIAMLYPIAAMEAYYNFNLPERNWGFNVPPDCDYQRVSDKLTCHVRRDFTFLHPDALAAQCTRQGATLRLNNATNWQEYQAIIIPGGKVIPWESLKIIKDFYDHGGKVIATTRLPEKSAEFGHDADVQSDIAEMFGSVPAYVAPSKPPGKPDQKGQGVVLPETEYAATPFQTRTNGNGGKAYFAAQPTVAALQAMLDNALPVPDVAFDESLRVSSGDGALSYLHKQKDGREIYFFANSSDDAVDTFVRLRGNLTPQFWNPHTGEMTPAKVTHVQEHGQAITRLHLKLAPVTSLFVIAP
ncbi:MAG: glycosyl hydrolase [Verrucomicrobiota bacterium]